MMDEPPPSRLAPPSLTSSTAPSFREAPPSDKLVDRAPPSIDLPLTDAADAPPRDGKVAVELALWVTAQSPLSSRAVAAVEAILAEYDGSRVRLIVYDVSQGLPAAIDQDWIS